MCFFASRALRYTCLQKLCRKGPMTTPQTCGTFWLVPIASWATFSV